tara:strand:- start:551 stop:1603 length:1053 start_codon:yes stop_codon:yes gene_type:complete
MYKVNLLGRNTFTFQNIFPYEYPENGDYDFDVFITDAFYLTLEGRSEPLNLDDLKTKKLIIFNFDKCHIDTLIESVDKVFGDTDIEVLLLTLHHITDKEKMPPHINHIGFDFFAFEMVNRRNNEDYIFNLLLDTIHFKRPKKFLCLNKVPHPHRVELKEFLELENFKDKGWYSFGEWWTDDWENLDVLGGYQSDHQFGSNLGLYLTSYFSIWTETLYDGENIHSVKLTNKIFMSMLNMHPFFIVGQPKTLEYLRNAGFKTFNNFWNEDYDNEFKSEFRMNKIKHELRRILSKSNDTIHKEFFGHEWDGDRNKIYNSEMFKILKHNYLFLPKHIENERNKVIEEINKFMGS